MQSLGHPHREAWHKMGRRFKQRFHLDRRAQEELDPIYRIAPPGTCRVQVVRSVCDWSHGVLKECSIQNACSSFLLVGSDRSTDYRGFPRPSNDTGGKPLHLYWYVARPRLPEKRLTLASKKTNSCTIISPSLFPAMSRV